MIVLLRDQLPSVAARSSLGTRARAVAALHAPILAQLQSQRARAAHSFQLVNGFSTSLTAAEAGTLAARADVLAVVPDRMLRLPERSARDSQSVASQQPSAATPPSASGLCDTLEPEALQLTHAAFVDPSLPQAQRVLDGNGALVTGKGVKVGIVADGLDTTIPGFIHTDGSPVFTDFQDFSGDPAGTPTAGGEMFGDASSIAAQDTPNGEPLTYDLSKFVSVAHPLPSPCNIRIRGMAPGASLVGLKVFSSLGYTSTSTFVQAIDYAVAQGGVDVLNESFGNNVYPDLSQDPISLANEAAVRAGVTVVVSTGDAGTAGTLGSPSTDSQVIASGATMQFRLYAQTTSSGYALAKGYLDGNISAFSSSGFAQKNARTVDLVAPGDSGWALCSTNAGLYQDCGDFSGNPSPIEEFGGTSESAPLTSGAAALVIQAYRSTHGGESPSPALVKNILMSAATDLGAPSSEQGAGFVDALQAVNTALSLADQNGRPARRGQGIVVTPNSVHVSAQPNQPLVSTFQVTNTGTKSLEITPALQTLGAPVAGETKALTFDPTTLPTYSSGGGAPRPYLAPTFTVPAGVDHLDAVSADPLTDNGAKVTSFIILLDPSGRDAAYTSPQGSGSGNGHVDIVKPQAGSWTAIIGGFPATTSGTFTGTVQFTWAAERYVSAGSVLPRSLALAPGQTGSVLAVLDTPSQPGDLAAAVRFLDRTGSSAFPEIPFTVRTLIALGKSGGDFTGTLTGGNGRGAAPTQTYELEVPANVNDLELSVSVPSGGYKLAGYFVDPHGMILGSSSTVDPSGASQNALSIFRADPEPGRWRFVLEETQASGAATSAAFNGHVTLNGARFSAPTLPTHAATPVSVANGLSVPINVTNTGLVAKAYFADARLDALKSIALAQSPCSQTATTPGLCLQTFLPTQTTDVRFVAQANGPINMDVGPFSGSPDIFARIIGGDTAVASAVSPEVAFGPWFMEPADVAPFGDAGAPTESVTMTATVTTQPLDPAVTASTGDLWADAILGTASYSPLVIGAGASGTITLAIRPDATQVGRTVRGYVYLDTFNEADPYGVGDEAVRIPYAYTVTR